MLTSVIFCFSVCLGLMYTILNLIAFDDSRLKLSFPFYVVAAVLLYIASHLLRITRLYIIFIERKFSFLQLLKIYTITAWVNMVIPFKIGEMFRVSEFSKLCKSFKMGFVSVWVERFFDTLLLLIFAVVLSAYTGTTHYALLIILFLFVAVTLFAFFSFPFSYRYSKQLTLSHSQSSKGLLLLEFMESLKLYYTFAKKLVRGRFPILFGLTLLIWLLEGGVFYYVTCTLTSEYNLDELMRVLNGVWASSKIHGDSGMLYKIVGFGVLTIGGISALINQIIFHFVNKRENLLQSNNNYHIQYQFRK
nr:lysylphosphatidylglycerol synthase transmembrane domain-containing protein [Cohnella lubricantis]